VWLAGAGQLIESRLAPLARFDMGDDPGFFCRVELKVQQRLKLSIART
jgi:hypothetical protein